MTHWRLLACWLGALAIAGIALALVSREPELPKPSLEDRDVVVIGTSLVHRAIPAQGGPEELLPGYGPHLRIGLAASSRAEILELLDHAVAEDVRLVLLEVNPLVFAFSSHSANLDCPTLACISRNFAALERRRYSAGMRHMLGLPTSEQIRMDRAIAEPMPYHWAPSDQPLRSERLEFHAAGNADIAEAVWRARENGTQIALLLPPRSPEAERLMPDGQPEELAARARALAQWLSVPLFAPREGWGKAEFVDRAHMSREGRDRFLRELRAWWEAAQ